MKKYERDYFAEAHQILKGQGYKSYIELLLPGGKWQNGEWVVKNPTRNDNKAGSFLINGNTGKWCDFAIGKAGRDLIGLTAYIKGISLVEACHHIGVARPAPKFDVIECFEVLPQPDNAITEPTFNKGGNV